MLMIFEECDSEIDMECNSHTCQVNLDISGSPIDFQWGSRQYPR